MMTAGDMTVFPCPAPTAMSPAAAPLPAAAARSARHMSKLRLQEAGYRKHAITMVAPRSEAVIVHPNQIIATKGVGRGRRRR